MARQVLKVLRLGLCGSILMIALVQGFLPEADISLLIPGGIGFIGTAIAAAKVAVVA